MKKKSISVALLLSVGFWLMAPGCYPGTEWNPNAKPAATQGTAEKTAQPAIPNMKQDAQLLTIHPKELRMLGTI